MSRALVPVTPANRHVLNMLVEARHAEVLAIRMAHRFGGAPGQHARPAYDLLNTLAGRPALLQD